jgi:hypothetical protein
VASPSRTIQERVDSIQPTLETAADFLTDADLWDITEQRGKILFQRKDMEGGGEFHDSLKNRFFARSQPTRLQQQDLASISTSLAGRQAYIVDAKRLAKLRLPNLTPVPFRPTRFWQNAQ